MTATNGSAYGNPQPYASAELERHAIEGRLKVARWIATNSSRPTIAARWHCIVDELLDHLAEIDARAGSAALARDCRGGIVPPWPVGDDTVTVVLSPGRVALACCPGLVLVDDDGVGIERLALEHWRTVHCTGAAGR